MPSYDEWKLASPYETTPAQQAQIEADADFAMLVRAEAKAIGLSVDIDCVDGKANFMVAGDAANDDVAPMLALLASRISNAMKRRRRNNAATHTQ